MEVKILLFVALVLFPIAVTFGIALFVKWVRRNQAEQLRRKEATIDLMRELIDEKEEVLNLYRQTNS